MLWKGVFKLKLNFSLENVSYLIDALFFPPHTAFPLTIVQDLQNVALLVTAHGGHIAFLQGLFPRGESYMERVFGQFVQAVFDHPRELNKACGIQE